MPLSWIHSPTTRRRFGMFLVVLAFLTTIQVLAVTWQLRHQAACQSQYNSTLAEAVKERTNIANQDIDNVYNFLDEVNRLNNEARQPGADIKAIQSEYQQLLQRFVDQREELEKQRAETPLPKRPKCDARTLIEGGES